MNNVVPLKNGSAEVLEKLILRGDLSSLTPEQKVSYYNTVCQSMGLNPLATPFAYMRLNGREVLYATRACTDQLRSVHKVSIKITSRELLGDVYVVTALARVGDREDESTGAVSVKSLSGEALANAYMKAETKAKRRVTLSVCGLAVLDETEVETIPHAKKVEVSASEVKAPQATSLPVAEIPSGECEVEAGDGEYQIQVGKKYLGMRLSEVPHEDLIRYAEWLSKQERIDHKGEEFLAKVREYLGN